MHNFSKIQHLKKAWWFLIVFGFCFLQVSFALANGCIGNFSWLPNTESNIAGYKIYYGQTSGGPYSNVVDVGNPDPVDGRIQGTVTGLVCGQEYYFVCVAYTDTGVESDYSTQLAVSSSKGLPGTPDGLGVIK